MAPKTLTSEIVALLRQHLTPRDTPLIMFHSSKEPTGAVICTQFGWKTFNELKRTIVPADKPLDAKNYGRIVFPSITLDDYCVYNSERNISMPLAFDNYDHDASDNDKYSCCVMYLPPGWSIKVEKQESDEKPPRGKFETIKVEISWYERTDDEFKTELREALAALNDRGKKLDAVYVMHNDEAHAKRVNELVHAALPNDDEWRVDTFKAGVRIHLTCRSTFNNGYLRAEVYGALHPQDYAPPKPESSHKKRVAPDEDEDDENPTRKDSPLPEGEQAYGVFAHAAYGRFVFPQRSIRNGYAVHTIAENQPTQATAFWHTSNNDMNKLAGKNAELHRDKRVKQE